MAQIEHVYDFAGWRARMQYDKQQAATALGISPAWWWKLEKFGKGALVYSWACYGIEAYARSGK